MKILCLADLHRLEFDRLAMQEQDRWIAQLLETALPDAVIIVGDVFKEKSEAMADNAGMWAMTMFHHFDTLCWRYHGAFLEDL